MVLRTWMRVLLTALGVAAATGAGQLGFGYGLGFVRFARDFLDGAEHFWPGQLAWVAWFAMVAAVVGAIAGARTASRHGIDPGLLGRIGTATVAGLGAAIVAPLTMRQARSAEVTDAIDPVITVGLTALLGAVAGIVLAAVALESRTLAWNMTGFIGAVWLLALASTAPSLGPDDALPTVRLAVLDLPTLSTGTTRNLALIGIPALALLAGVATALAVRLRGRRATADASGDHPTTPVVRGHGAWRVFGRWAAYPGTAACGVVGPGVLALAYLLAGPGDAAAQATPYWSALAALMTGILGSALVVAVPAADEVEPSPERHVTIDESTTSSWHDTVADWAGGASPQTGGAASQLGGAVSQTGGASSASGGPPVRPSGSPAEATSSPRAASPRTASPRTASPRATSPRTAGSGSDRPGTGRGAPTATGSNNTDPGTGPDRGTGARGLAALTEPTPDPLTAPLEELRPSKRAARQRARTAAQVEGARAAARAERAEPAQRPAATGGAPDPAPKPLPDVASTPLTAAEPSPAPERRSWLSRRRGRPTSAGTPIEPAPPGGTPAGSTPSAGYEVAAPAESRPTPERRSWLSLRRGRPTSADPAPPPATSPSVTPFSATPAATTPAATTPSSARPAGVPTPVAAPFAAPSSAAAGTPSSPASSSPASSSAAFSSPVPADSRRPGQRPSPRPRPGGRGRPAAESGQGGAAGPGAAPRTEPETPAAGTGTAPTSPRGTAPNVGDRPGAAPADADRQPPTGNRQSPTGNRKGRGGKARQAGAPVDRPLENSARAGIPDRSPAKPAPPVSRSATSGPAKPAPPTDRTPASGPAKPAPPTDRTPIADPSGPPVERASGTGDGAPDEHRRSRFGLFRRGPRPVPAQRGPAEPEKIAPRDEEYVDWVAGLGDTPPSRRTP